MSGGGGNTNTIQSTEPWSGVRPYLFDMYSQSAQLANQPRQYYPGSTVVGPTDSETAAWQSRSQYDQNVFGGAPTLNYGDATQSLTNHLTGNTSLQGMGNTLAPGATGAVNQAFSPYDISGRFDINPATGTITQPTAQAGQIGQYGFGTTLDAAGRAPQFGMAGGLDATGAYERMLSGQPDYSNVQANIDAANAGVMRQLTNEIIPQLNTRATFTNNMTGGIKGLNAAMPEIAARMNENAVQIREAERVRALQEQERAANTVSQGGLAGYGLGLQTAQGERGLEQSLAGLGLSTDTTRAQLGQADARLGMEADLARYGIGADAAQFQLAREQAREAALGGYRGDVLGYGSLAGNLAEAGSQEQGRAQLQFPALAEYGRTPVNDMFGYANYDRALQEDLLGADIDRFNFEQNAPYMQQEWLNSILSGTAGLGGTTTTSMPGGSRTAAVLGGALTGASAGGAIGGAYAGTQAGGSMAGPYGALIGALLGGAYGYFA